MTINSATAGNLSGDIPEFEVKNAHYISFPSAKVCDPQL
jgi:hypothetical protein